MDRETARQEIRSRIKCTDYLQPSKSGLYCCPYCGSGHGFNATGAVKYYPDTNTWCCFSCKKTGDVIDLYQQESGTDYNGALSVLAQEICVTIDPYRPPSAAGFSSLAKIGRVEGSTSDFNGHGSTSMPPTAKTPQNGSETTTEDTADYTAYYRECRKRLNDPAAVSYLSARGISPATAAEYWIGFDPKADPAQSGHPTPRIIIPTCSGHYIGRSVDPKTPKQFAKLNNKGGKPAIFNMRVLYAQEVQAVFVTEGAFDALSILEAGAAAIALNSAANAETLIRHLEQRRTAATLILCLDNDAAGKKATETIRAGLQRLNIAYVSADICAGYKDPNEALTCNKDAFFEAIEQARRQTAAKPDNTAFYIDAIMSGDIARFRNDKKTGFRNLDAEAGGLYSGLYVLAAISSLGKTSFALQLADQLAEQGNDIVFFSLEQSKLELVSKSLARRTAQTDPEKAVTSLSIRKGYLPPQVLAAAEAYKAAVGDRLSIVEGNFDCNISFIGDYLRRYIARNNSRPVVILDYLQILQPVDSTKRQSLKETVDTTVTELKRISRELDLTVIVISSVNRQNYMTPIDFESLKESGGIEFTADVVWGLQLQCINDPIFEKDKGIKEKREKIKAAKAANPRKIELSCLKNRYGKSSYSCYFNYFPANDLFTECSKTDLDFDMGAERFSSNCRLL